MGSIVEINYRPLYIFKNSFFSVTGLEKLKDEEELEIFLFGGLSKEEYYSRHRVATSEKRSHITGRLTFDPETRQISYYKTEVYQSDPTSK